MRSRKSSRGRTRIIATCFGCSTISAVLPVPVPSTDDSQTLSHFAKNTLDGQHNSWLRPNGMCTVLCGKPRVAVQYAIAVVHPRQSPSGNALLLLDATRTVAYRIRTAARSPKRVKWLTIFLLDLMYKKASLVMQFAAIYALTCTPLCSKREALPGSHPPT